MKNKNLLFLTFMIFNINFITAQSIVIKNATIYNGIDDIPFSGNILIEDGLIKRVSESSLPVSYTHLTLPTKLAV